MWASKCESRYLKVLGPLTEQIDAIKDVSLIKDVFVFYAEGSSTKHDVSWV